jgi:hypothetical protein
MMVSPMAYRVSQHALKQMFARGISKEIVESVLLKPDQTIEQDDLMVFQSIITDEQVNRFLIRVFVNINKAPPLVVTVYKTSKIEKYYEGKI